MSFAETSHLGGRSSGSGDRDRTPGRRVIQLQGPRPSPLTVNKASRKLGKPPLPANREPVIIYAVSPKVIHTQPSDFMSVVQRLTGLCSSSAPVIFSGEPVSPAARMAATERTSPTGRVAESELMGGMEGWDGGCQIPGILSPAPANLPEVTAGMFSQMMDTQTQLRFQDNLYGNYFQPTPSSNALFSATTLFSPSHSPAFDISKLFYS